MTFPDPDGAEWAAHTVAVVVTYGDRAELAISTADAALAAGVSQVVLVDNGSRTESRRRLQDWSATRPGRVSLTRLSTNTGSAGGFRAGIAEALRTRRDWVLLLDDDNLLDPRAFQHIGGYTVASTEAVAETAFVLHRSADLAQARILSGWPASAAYQRPGSFIWFDIRNRLRRAPRSIPARPQQPVPVPAAPYGGLLIKDSTLERFGPPREDLVLYQDDTEFTERLAAGGVSLMLIPVPLITDLDGRPAPSLERQQGGIVSLLRTPPSMGARVYYTVRNSVWLDLRRARRLRDRLFLLANAAAYLARLVTARLMGVGEPHLFRLVVTAVFDGMRGRLSQTVELPPA